MVLFINNGHLLLLDFNTDLKLHFQGVPLSPLLHIGKTRHRKGRAA